jgi:hypothetical protein
MKFILIFEDKKENTETLEMYFILAIFREIKTNLPRIKKNNLSITLIQQNGEVCRHLSKPEDTNVLIKMVKDYYKFIERKLAISSFPKKDEILVFNTGNSEWFDTNVWEALKRPCDKSTKLFIVNKKDLIKVSESHTKLGIYKLTNKNK